MNERTQILNSYQCKECTFYFKSEDIICISEWDSDEYRGFYCKKCIEVLGWKGEE